MTFSAGLYERDGAKAHSFNQNLWHLKEPIVLLPETITEPNLVKSSRHTHFHISRLAVVACLIFTAQSVFACACQCVWTHHVVLSKAMLVYVLKMKVLKYFLPFITCIITNNTPVVNTVPPAGMT